MAKTDKTRTTCVLQLPENQTEIPESSINQIIAQTVDETLSSFGQGFKQAMYTKLEENYHIRKRDIPDRIEEFANAIETEFGAGAKVIELRIIEALHKKMPAYTHFPKQGDLLFANYVEDLRYF